MQKRQKLLNLIKLLELDISTVEAQALLGQIEDNELDKLLGVFELALKRQTEIDAKANKHNPEKSLEADLKYIASVTDAKAKMLSEEESLALMDAEEYDAKYDKLNSEIQNVSEELEDLLKESTEQAPN